MRNTAPWSVFVLMPVTHLSSIPCVNNRGIHEASGGLSVIAPPSMALPDGFLRWLAERNLLVKHSTEKGNGLHASMSISAGRQLLAIDPVVGVFDSQDQCDGCGEGCTGKSKCSDCQMVRCWPYSAMREPRKVAKRKEEDRAQ